MRYLMTATVCFLLLACSFPCSDKVVSSLENGERDFLLQVVERDCGATTDYATHVGARKSRWFFPGQVNLVVFEGRPEVKLCWTGSKDIKIWYSEGRMFNPQTEYLGMKIRFEQSQQPSKESCH